MKNKDIYVVLNNVRSRENVGSIFRTADATGVSKIYLCGITPTPPREKISKTALSAEEYIPWEYHKQASRLIDKLKKEGINTIALEQTKESENLFKFKPKFLPAGPPAGRAGRQVRLALILGNEVEGISPAILKKCDKKIAIPMYGRKESLNVVVAAGIALYSIINA